VDRQVWVQAVVYVVPGRVCARGRGQCQGEQLSLKTASTTRLLTSVVVYKLGRCLPLPLSPSPPPKLPLHPRPLPSPPLRRYGLPLSLVPPRGALVLYPSARQAAPAKPAASASRPVAARPVAAAKPAAPAPVAKSSPPVSQAPKVSPRLFCSSRFETLKLLWWVTARWQALGRAGQVSGKAGPSQEEAFLLKRHFARIWTVG
jgi:hypothetical protein